MNYSIVLVPHLYRVMMQIVIMIDTIIDYEVLTDNELKGVSNNEQQGDYDADLKDTDVSPDVDF